MMRTKGKSWFCIAGLIASMVCVLCAAEFVPPAEGPVAFRRDRIPLEAEGMAGLSNDLELLARGLDAKTPADLRGAAQILALALALDPGNSKARNLISGYRNGRHVADGDGDQLKAGGRRIWKSVAWLETPEAGIDGQALAACLKDVLVVADPANPKADAIRTAGQQGAWAGWVPDISAYETKPVVSELEPEDNVPVVEEPEENAIMLGKAEVKTPLWQPSGKSSHVKWELSPAPLRMTAATVKDDPEEKAEFSIVFGKRGDAAAFRQLGDTLKDLLEKQHGTLPKGVRIHITSQEFEKSVQSRNRQSISAAAAVLASSAITGQEPEAIIIGQIDGAGAFKLPTRFWYQLQALGVGNGERLVLPAEAAGYLPSILAMEKPEFFFGYEVVLASDFAQLLEMSAKVPKESLASAAAKFREIRERAGNLGVRTYIDNSFVKQRLAAVLQDMPSHISAKMLLIQASGNRPTKVSRKVLAAELRRALEPVPTILIQQDGDQNMKLVAKVGEVYESCRTRVEGLDRYAEREDKDLVDEAREVAISIRNLDRVSRSRSDDYSVNLAVQTARSNLTALYDALIQKLADEIGDGAIPKDL